MRPDFCWPRWGVAGRARSSNGSSATGTSASWWTWPVGPTPKKSSVTKATTLNMTQSAPKRSAATFTYFCATNYWPSITRTAPRPTRLLRQPHGLDRFCPPRLDDGADLVPHFFDVRVPDGRHQSGGRHV